MKKYFLSIVALAGMLFATSCQESLVEPQVGGTTTFTVQVPDQMGTKADPTLGLAANVNQLFVAVYADALANNATPIYRTVAPVSNGQATVKLNLIQDQFYDVIFWAQVDNNYVSAVKTDNEYTFDLVNIPMNKDYHNTDNGAAFFYYWDNFKPTGTSQPVTLRRPFAQLNLGTTEGSLTNNAGTFTLQSSVIKVKGIADNFNTVSGFGTVTETNKDIEYTFDAALLPSDATIKVAGVDYKYVSMDYLPIVGDDQALITVDATITLSNDQSIYHKFTNVPVRENYRTNIVGNLISSSTDFNVVVDDRFVDENGDNVSDDNNILVVENAAAAQAALDNAKPGDVIELVAGVNYGILYLRPVKDSPATKEVDWIGNNYRWETYTLFENITILGAEGATVDAIKIEGGTYYNTEHSQKDKYPVMLSLIELKNVVIDGVTFTGKGGYDPQGYGNAINLSGRNIKVDGLTLKNCVLENADDNARLIYKTESTTAVHQYDYDGQTYTFTPSLKDITITGTTFNGGYIGLELRETNNVTITDNVFNVGDRNILLASNSGCTYSGKVTITGNVSNNAKERFVRMSGAGNAEVVIKDNYIYNYQGADADYIKVTDGSNVTIENNVLMVTSALDLQSRVNSAAEGLNEFGFANDITGNVTILQNDKINIVINGLGKKYDGTINVDGNGRDTGEETLTIKKIKFNTTENDRYFIYVHKRDGSGFNVNAHNLYVEDCTFNGNGSPVAIRVEAGAQLFNLNVERCKAENMHSFYQGPLASSASFKKVSSIGGRGINVNSSFGSLYFENCKFEATKDDGYGLRVDCQREGIIEMKNSEFKAYNPVYMRYISQNITLKFDENTKLSLNNNSDHSNQIYIERGNGYTGQVFSNRSFNCNETLNMNN